MLSIKSRRKSREATLQALYQCDACEDWSIESAQFFFHHYVERSAGDQANYEFSLQVCLGVLQNQTAIDHELDRASHHWETKRMSRVDRNILRLAVFELAFLSDVPKNVTINEAIELAKKYGTDDSRPFVNGILDKIAVELEGPAKQRISASLVQNELALSA